MPGEWWQWVIVAVVVIVILYIGAFVLGLRWFRQMKREIDDDFEADRKRLTGR